MSKPTAARRQDDKFLAEVHDLVADWPLSEEAEQAWRQQAICAGVDPELFYPGRGGDAEPAKAVCRRCPVRPQCLATALMRGEKFGTWGGLTELERRPLRRRLALARTTAVAS